MTFDYGFWVTCFSVWELKWLAKPSVSSYGFVYYHWVPIKFPTDTKYNNVYHISYLQLMFTNYTLMKFLLSTFQTLSNWNNSTLNQMSNLALTSKITQLQDRISSVSFRLLSYLPNSNSISFFYYRKSSFIIADKIVPVKIFCIVGTLVHNMRIDTLARMFNKNLDINNTKVYWY